MDLGGPNGKLLLNLMSATSLRARVIAGNVSNQNTPGFQRRRVAFEETLMRAVERGKTDLTQIAPEVVVDQEAPQRADGNSVNMEDEVVAMRQNRILYEIYASIMSGRGRILRSAIHGDR